MPFFSNMPNFPSLPNPLNIFSLDPSTSSHTTPHSITTDNVAGPSTPRSPTLGESPTSTPIPNGTIRPFRTALKAEDQHSSSDSFDKPIQTRRKSSGNNVMILDPHLLGGGAVGCGDDIGMDRAGRADGKGRTRQRPLSVASEMTGGSFENRRRKPKLPVETFVIVRPPPTAGKNPMNLQIQLVMKPPTRGRSASGMVSLRSVSTTATRTRKDSTSTLQTPISYDIDPHTKTPNHIELSDSSSADSANRQLDPGLVPHSASGSEVEIGSTPTPISVGSNLKRSSSVKSQESGKSGTTSVSSAGTGGGAKRIVPLYNLAVHNVVQPTTVCDAGTDSKVAKFLKRTLDITGVGVLEPSEVWLPVSHSSSANNLFPSPLLPSDEGHGPSSRLGRPLSMISSITTAPLSPTTTRHEPDKISPNKATVRASLDLKNFKLDNVFNKDGEGGTTKKFFGKMFKKKNNEENNNPRIKQSPSQSFSSLENVPPPNPGSGFLNRPQEGVTHAKAPSTATITPSDGHLGAPTFGTAPTVQRRTSGSLTSYNGAITGLTAGSSTAGASLGLGLPTSLSPSKPDASFPLQIPIIPSTRPIGYTWTVKKWTKKNSDGWAAHIVAAAAAGLDLVNGAGNGDGEEEVIFEWVKVRVPSPGGVGSGLTRFTTGGSTATTNDRTRSKSRGPSGLSHQSDQAPEHHNESKTSLTLQIPSRSTSPSPHPSPNLDNRPWPVRRTSASASPSPRRPSSPSILSAHTNENDTASLNGTVNGDLTAEEESDPEDSETPWTCSIWVKKTGHRQLLGTLTPAPHHPKVIGMLRIPRGLESVALAEVNGNGSTGAKSEMASKIKEDIALSEENLKDVVCVTAMWLVAREEFGGLGRKKRV